MPSSARRYKPPRPPGQRVAKRNARKEEQTKCVLAPRPKTHHPPRDGSIDLAEEHSVPEGRAKSALAPIRRPPSRAEGHCTGARTSAFFSSTGRGAFSFWARPKGAPAALRAVGRGGARERAQFSPQAETELSGLCDDAMGGASPVGTAPAGAESPGRLITAPTPPQESGGPSPLPQGNPRFTSGNPR